MDYYFHNIDISIWTEYPDGSQGQNDHWHVSLKDDNMAHDVWKKYNEIQKGDKIILAIDTN